MYEWWLMRTAFPRTPWVRNEYGTQHLKPNGSDGGRVKHAKTVTHRLDISPSTLPRNICNNRRRAQRVRVASRSCAPGLIGTTRNSNFIQARGPTFLYLIDAFKIDSRCIFQVLFLSTSRLRHTRHFVYSVPLALNFINTWHCGLV